MATAALSVLVDHVSGWAEYTRSHNHHNIDSKAAQLKLSTRDLYLAVETLVMAGFATWVKDSRVTKLPAGARRAFKVLPGWDAAKVRDSFGLAKKDYVEKLKQRQADALREEAVLLDVVNRYYEMKNYEPTSGMFVDHVRGEQAAGRTLGSGQRAALERIVERYTGVPAKEILERELPRRC